MLYALSTPASNESQESENENTNDNLTQLSRAGPSEPQVPFVALSFKAMSSSRGQEIQGPVGGHRSHIVLGDRHQGLASPPPPPLLRGEWG